MPAKKYEDLKAGWELLPEALRDEVVMYVIGLFDEQFRSSLKPLIAAHPKEWYTIYAGSQIGMSVIRSLRRGGFDAKIDLYTFWPIIIEEAV